MPIRVEFPHSWRNDPSTEKQQAFLVKEAVCTNAEAETLTEGLASDLIQAVIDGNNEALDKALDATFPEMG